MTPYELAPPATLPGGRIGDKGLLDDFPEDADLEHDPEVERALKAGGRLPEEIKPSVEPATEGEGNPPFVKPGMGEPQVVALVSVGLLLAAVVTSAINAENQWFASAVTTLYMALLHTATGIAAVVIAAKIVEAPLGSVELAAARMFAAVAVFQFFINLHIPIPGRFDEPILAAGAYWAVIMVLFRLPVVKTFYIGMLHAGLWFAIWLAMVLHAWATAVPAVTPAG